MADQVPAGFVPDGFIPDAKAQSAPAPKWYEPGGDVLLDNVRALASLPGKALRFVKEHPIESGAAAGAALAVPFTGGGSLPAAIAPFVPAAAAALGGAAGAGTGMIGGALAGSPNVPSTASDVVGGMAKQGAIQGAVEGGGQLAGAGLRAAGKGLYRAALRPAARLTDKYGDLVQAGVDQAAPIGASRVVQGRMVASKNAADALVDSAAQAGRSVPASAVTDRFMPLADRAVSREGLGVVGDIDEIATRERLFNAAHPTGQIDPVKALALKREADALASNAQNAVRRGASVNDMTAQLHDATRGGLKAGLEAIAPGLADQNAQTSTLYGLSRALRAAENRPHALSHGLSDLAGIGGALFGGNDTTSRGASGVGSYAAARAMMSPAVQSRAGILASAAGGAPIAQLVRLAMLAALSGTGSEQTPPQASQPQEDPK